VFVARPGEPGAFVRREVTVGRADGELAEVTAGLSPGDRVAVKGAFTLDSAAQRSEFGED
jgi:multidrug efflux pump subunit AcrA (membrane-fusion protein)